MVTDIREQIEDFLSHDRIAFVGVSRDSKSFSRGLLKELLRRGYDVVPVNPGLDEIEGRSCYRRVQDIERPVDGALLMTPPHVTERVVRDCAEAGIPRVWMHRGAGRGAVSDDAIAYCEGAGIAVVAGHCPYMFLPRAGFIHRVHRFFKRIEQPVRSAAS